MRAPGPMKAKNKNNNKKITLLWVKKKKGSFMEKDDSFIIFIHEILALIAQQTYLFDMCYFVDMASHQSFWIKFIQAWTL